MLVYRHAMTRSPRRLLGLLLAGGLVAACATAGVIRGQLSAPGQPETPVSIRYTPDQRNSGGVMSVTLPDGRAFSGRYGFVADALAGRAPWMTEGNPAFSEFTWDVGADAWTFGAPDSDTVLAKLVDDRDATMRCRFTLSYGPGGFRDGGTGECRLSTGGRIDAKF